MNRKLTISEISKTQTKHPRQLYKEVIFSLVTKAMKLILEGETIKLPQSLGSFKIIRYKNNNTKKKFVDYGETKRLNKTVYHTNLHTYGWGTKFCWIKDFRRIRNIAPFTFKVRRQDSRHLAQILKNSDCIFNYDER